MKEEPEEKQLHKTIALLVYRYGSTILLGVAAWAAMWVKVHAPTKTEFNQLVMEVRGLREDAIRLSNYLKAIDDHEMRLRKLEGYERKRFPRQPQDE